MTKTLKGVQTDQWPILILRPSRNLEEAKQAMAVVEEIYQTHKEPYALILDGREGKRPSAVERKLQNDFRIKYQDYVRKYCYGSALVCNSQIIRGVATAMFWVKKPDTATKVFTDMDEAMAWGRSILETQ
jgi:hypothetical protein